MATPYAPTILKAAATRLDPERLVTVARWLRSELYAVGADVIADPESHVEVWATGNVPLPHRDTLLEGILYANNSSTHAADVLQAPTVWLLSSLWWALHDDLTPEWLSQAVKTAANPQRKPTDARFPWPPAAVVPQLFTPGSTAFDVMMPHFGASAVRADRSTLLGGALWSLAHLYWAAAVLFYCEQPEVADRSAVSTPVAMAAQLLADLSERWLPGPWHAATGHARARHHGVTLERQG